MAASCIAKHGPPKCRVSSVLNRDVKQFGKKYMFDDNEETCWNSDQGSPQWILLEFQSAVELQELQIQFQGGFVGKECWIEGSTTDANDLHKICDIHPKDDNSLQSFDIPGGHTAKFMRLTFASSTDFYGRITIYKLDVIETQR
ncbi:nuclear receptor 2C2-associated protein-like [Amphiura filiformis]|uniref:nuclear receptor 2C2-associated protein-like n=1 Tax=Amphiura filiformis TaxID=82378 RepID=UPI003B22096E